jgi:hypothetical protein
MAAGFSQQHFVSQAANKLWASYQAKLRELSRAASSTTG